MQTRNPSKESVFSPLSGYAMLAFLLAFFVASVWTLVHGITLVEPKVTTFGGVETWLIIGGIAGLITFGILLPGYFVVEPNLGRVLVLFGRYRGTVRSPGFWWTNPFTSKKKISLRAHNLNAKTLKVNDLLGNPIEIAAIVVWQVRDSAQAVFDVEGFDHFVEVQCESAVRYVASRHPYDDGQTSDVSTTLRGSADVIAHELQQELQQRITLAGVEVIEARLSHLAYAPEIAAAMLQRQQAGAIIAARSRMVEGAVGMVQMALQHLGEKEIVHLDDERKATLIGNLLVVLCGHVAPTPVLNTGGLYN